MEQFLSAKYLSGRSANQKIGVVGSTEEQKVLEVIGNVGIGTTIFDPTQKLDVRGSVSVADTITATTVNATTVVVTGTGNTFADLTVTGLSTFSGNIDANGNLDVDGLSDLDELNVAGISTFGSDVDVNASVDISNNLTVDGLSDLDELNVAGLSTFASDVDVNASVDISTNLTVDGLSDLDELNVAGVSTFASDVDVNASVDISTNLTVDGLSDLDELNVAGISTFGSDVDVNASVDISTSLTVGSATTITGAGIVAGIVTGTLDNDLTLATSGTGLSGSATYNNSGAATFTVTSNATDANTAGTIVARDGSGNFSAGTITADLTGVASTATQLETARDFSITGSFVTASAVSFDGTANVALGATITPDSITLGTYTSGDYVESITGTANEVEVTGGTGEGSTPQIGLPNDVTIGEDLTVNRDVQINRNLNVDGNITIGGTSATLFTQTLTVADSDLILGVRTDGLGNDISNDTTANHGGIAIASTEGNPLITIVNPGAGETLPSTYKKIMWFKSGSFVGLGTDAWLSNYAVGIGSTQFPTGTRLAAGSVQFTENDLAVVRNINASGIATLPTIDAANATIDNLTFTSGTAITSVDTDLTTVSASDDTLASAKAIKDYVDNEVSTAVGNVALNFAGDTGTGAIDLDSETFTIAGTANEIETVGTGNTLTIGLPGSVAITTSLVVGSAVTITSSGIDAVGIISASRFVSDVTTGTAPLTVSSTTLVSNLNADLLDGQEGSYYTNASNINAGTIGDAYLPATISSDITGNAATATTATNLTDAANITTGTISDDRLPDLITSNINISSGISTVSQLVVGSAVTITSSGIDASSGIITALQFVGTASTASFATTAFTLNGTSEAELSVGSAVTATNLAGGDAGDIPYQSAANTTTFVDASLASTGQVLLWNGSTPSWGNVSSAAGAFGGISVQDESTPVGTAGSVATLNFVGSNIQATATTGANGISTITLSDTPTFDSLTVTGLTSTQNLNVVGVSTFNNDVFVGSGITMYASTGIISATAFYGSGLNLTDLINQRIEGLQIQEEGSDVGIGYSFATLNFIGDNITATGVGTIANITVSDTPTFDTLSVTGIATLGTVEVNSGIITATSGIVTYYGDGQYLQNIISGVSISTETTNQSQFIPYAISTGTTTGFGVTTTSLVFNPSTNRLGVGTDSPQATLHVVDEFLLSTAGAASTQRITERAYTTDNGTLSWEGSAGQLFSITNNLTSGSIFSVNDVSGIPSIDVDADGTIQLAPFGATEFVGVGTTAPTAKLHVVGDARVSGVVTATSFVGDLTGTATTATNIDISATSSGDTTSYVVLVGNNVTGGQQPYIDNGSLTYNASTNVLTAGGGFSGDGSALTALNASQITSGTIPGDRGVTSGSTSSSFVEYNGTTKTAGQFDGGTTDPSDTTRLNYDGYFYSTRLYSDSAIVGSAVTINSSGIVVTGIVTATDFNSTSDAKLKTNVQVIEDPLEKVLQINGVSFNWIKDNKPSMGVIADNIQEVLPELVSDSDPKTVNYNGLIGLLIECVKQQQEEINILKESINNNK